MRFQVKISLMNNAKANYDATFLLIDFSNKVRLLLQESLHEHWHFNDIFYLNFLKELLILLKANFSDILHCRNFLLRVIKNMLFSKISTYHQSFRYNFNLNQN